MGVLWDLSGRPGGCLRLSWGPSEISEIVTIPTRELHFRFFMGLSWALLGLSWALLGVSWGGSLGVLLGLSCALLVLSWGSLGLSWVCRGLSQGFQASSATLASRFPTFPGSQASSTCLRSSTCVFVSIVVGSCLVDSLGEPPRSKGK